MRSGKEVQRPKMPMEKSAAESLTREVEVETDKAEKNLKKEEDRSVMKKLEEVRD